MTIVAARVVFEVALTVEDFEGFVESVDLDSRTATLDNGIVVRLDDASRVRHEEGDRLRLASLEAVAEARAAGTEVRAHGEGAVESHEPLTILAFHVLFKLVIPIEDFRGRVEAVNLDAGTVTLVEGIVVRVDGETTFRLEDGHDHLLPSLEAVAEALDAGNEVFAAGEGEVEGQEPLTILAYRVKFEEESRRLRTSHESHRQMKRKNGAGTKQNISVIAPGARIVGDVHTSGVIQVAGTVVGNIRAECKVLVAKGGMVDGDIKSREADVGGEVRGRVLATERVAVQASAALHGTITTPQLAVDEGAIMDVELCMSESEALLDLNHRRSNIRKLSPDPAITHEGRKVVGLGLAR